MVSNPQIKIAKYVPKSVYEIAKMYILNCLESIAKHEKEITRESRNDFINLHKTEQEYDRKTIFYIYNYIQDNPVLKEYFQDFSNHAELLIDTLSVFYSLRDWQYDYNKTPKQDASVAKNIAKNLSKAASFLYDSPDVWLSLQIRLNDICENNKKVKTMKRLELSHLLSEMANTAEVISKQAKVHTGNLVKKPNDREAHIHYIVRHLKAKLIQHKTPKRKHVKIIADLVYGVMEINLSEERIRKLVS